jgi:hypothetical protein
MWKGGEGADNNKSKKSRIQGFYGLNKIALIKQNEKIKSNVL